MCPPITCFHTLKGSQFRKNQGQQTGTVQIYKPFRGNRRKYYLIKFIGNTLLGDNGYTPTVAAQRLKCSIINIKVQLSGKTDAPHHAQWVVTKCNIRVKRSTDCFFFQIFYTTERVYQFSEPALIQADSQCIDSKIPPILIVFQCTVFNDGLTGVALIRLLTCTNKLHFYTTVFYLCGTKILKQGYVCSTSQAFTQRFGHLYTTTYYYNINILRRALQENIAHISADYITFQSQFICCLGYPFEYIVAEMLFQFFCRQFYHTILFKIII